MHQEDKELLTGCATIILLPIILVAIALVIIAIYYAVNIVLIIAIYWLLTYILYGICELIMFKSLDRCLTKRHIFFSLIPALTIILMTLPTINNNACDFSYIQENIKNSLTNLQIMGIPYIISCISVYLTFFITKKLKYSEEKKYTIAYTVSILQMLSGYLITQGCTSIFKILFYSSIVGIIPIIILLLPPLINNTMEKINVKYLYRLGNSFYKDGQYKKALKYYEKAFSLDKNTNSFFYYYTIGMVYYRLKDYSSAICHLEMAFDFKKRDEICVVLTDIYKEKGDIKKGTEWYNNLLDMYDKNSDKYKKYSQQKDEYIKSVKEKQTRIKQTIQENEIKNLYKKFEDAFSTKQYQTAIKLAKELTELAPENSEYKDKLAKVQKLYDNEKASIEQLYQEAISSEKENDYQKAIDLITKAKKTASRLDESVKKYDALLQKYNKKIKIIEAEDIYINAKKYFEDKNYLSALFEIKRAIKLVPNNKTYIDLKNTIDFEIKKNENEAKFQELYEQAAEYYLDGDLNNASYAINQALFLKPNNEIAKELSEKINSGKIDIMTCTKRALLSLGFINDEQAENIIQARDEGVMWYDYQKFSEQFGIMPHQWVDVEEKIDFPLKQANKYGRKLDI